MATGTRVFEVFGGKVLLCRTTMPPSNKVTKDELYQISLSWVRFNPKRVIRTTLDGVQIYPLV